MKDTKIERNGKTYMLSSRPTENRWFNLYTIYEVDPATNNIINMLGKRIAMNLDDALNDVLKDKEN